MVKTFLVANVDEDQLANPERQDAEVKDLSDAIWTHKVVIVKGQKDLAPLKQWELVTRFDPEAPQVHSHGDLKTYKEKGGVLSVRCSLPLAWTCVAFMSTNPTGSSARS
jgi:hypothetical protein